MCNLRLSRAADVSDDGVVPVGDDDYEEVATKVTGSLDRWGCWDASWSVPTSSAITQACKRLGRKMFAEVFGAVAEPEEVDPSLITLSSTGFVLSGHRLARTIHKIFDRPVIPQALAQVIPQGVVLMSLVDFSRSTITIHQVAM
jgi:hypothetical protein